MTGICYIAGSGDFTARDFKCGKDDYVIAADGGYAHLLNAGIKPDLLVGDFDSLRLKAPTDVEIMRFPPEKDDTDMGLALSVGLEKGYTRFRIYGGSGSRFDHFFANMQLALRNTEKGIEIRIVAPEFTLYALSKGTLTMNKPAGTVFSVFSATDEAGGVSITGAKYTLENAHLSNRFPLGVSNEFTGDTVTVSVENGILWIFEYLSPDYK